VPQLKKLLNDWLLVELEEVPEKTAGGIVIPDTYASVRFYVGRVTQVGPGRWYSREKRFIPTQATPGVRVLFPAAAVQTKNGALLLHHLRDGEVLIRETDVLLELSDDCTTRFS